MLWVGRGLMVGVPIYAVWCRYALDGWAGVPQEDGLPLAWSFDVLMVAGIVFGGILPWVAIPIGSAVRTEIYGRTLRVRTVLGTRTIDLEGARLRCWMGPGEGRAMKMTSVRQGWRWVVVAESGMWPRPRWLTDFPRVASTWVSWVKGWTVAVSGGLSAFVVSTLMIIVAGVVE